MLGRIERPAASWTFFQPASAPSSIFGSGVAIPKYSVRMVERLAIFSAWTIWAAAMTDWTRSATPFTGLTGDGLVFFFLATWTPWGLAVVDRRAWWCRVPRYLLQTSVLNRSSTTASRQGIGAGFR